MRALLHNPTIADVVRHDTFCTLEFEKSDARHDEEVCLFLTAEQEGMARAIADIFNSNLPALVSRIEDAMLAIHDAEVDFRDYATAIACDIIGKDLSEALRDRREAEDAA